MNIGIKKKKIFKHEYCFWPHGEAERATLTTSSQFPTYTLRRHKATLAFMCDHVPGHLRNAVLKFTLLSALKYLVIQLRNAQICSAASR